MKVSVRFFGAFSTWVTPQPLQLELVNGARVAELRDALDAYLRRHLPELSPALLRCSAFADSARVLAEDEPLPADGQVAVLPPVSGG